MSYLEHRIDRRKLLRAGIWSVVGLAGLGAAACGPSTPQPPAAPAGGKPAAPTAAPAGAGAAAKPTTAAAKEPTPKRGQILNAMIFSTPERPDSTQTTSGRVHAVNYQIYGHLLRLDPEGFGDTRLYPEAVKKWTTSPDGKEWTLDIQEGIKWHNKPPLSGREFTAEDVGWNIDYYKTKSIHKNLWADVESWQAVNKYQIKLRLKAPNADQLGYMGSFFNQMMPREVYERDGNFDKATIGTGPMMYKGLETGVKVSLEKNPDYWEKSPVDGKPLPYVDGEDVYIIPDKANQFTSWITGKIDRVLLGAPTFAEVEQLKKQSKDLIITMDRGKPCIQLFMINCSVKPFDDKRVRQALSLSLDRDVVGTAAFGKGNYEWKSFVPVDGYGMTDAEAKKYFPYDPDKAKALLKEAGVAPGTPLTITPYSQKDEMYKSQAEAAQQLWSNVGFKVDIKWVETTEWEKRKAAGDFVIGSLPAQVSSEVDNWLGTAFSSKSPRNFGKFSSTAVDDALAASKAELDIEKRKALVRKAELLLVEEMPIVPTVYQLYPYIRQSWLQGERSGHWFYPFPRVEKIWLSR